eukprot:7330666-Pyramimonas_sp.AAC.1
MAWLTSEKSRPMTSGSAAALLASAPRLPPLSRPLAVWVGYELAAQCRGLGWAGHPGPGATIADARL